MGVHFLELPAPHVECLAELLHSNDQGALWTPAGSRTGCTVGLTDEQVRYLQTLTADDDGYIEDGVMWIGGTDYPLETGENGR